MILAQLALCSAGVTASQPRFSGRKSRKSFAASKREKRGANSDVRQQKLRSRAGRGERAGHEGGRTGLDESGYDDDGSRGATLFWYQVPKRGREASGVVQTAEATISKRVGTIDETTSGRREVEERETVGWSEGREADNRAESPRRAADGRGGSHAPPNRKGTRTNAPASLDSCWLLAGWIF